ncbi:inositol monophosphatase family protein [Sciscionella marina]|uniref:inositol monophosphatase family protein n=1 Tax=Sciscionella marina TaxID=508770 RepID=UPI00035E1F7A|nr:inositol monophosphatase family protein [Sciscionella marina]
MNGMSVLPARPADQVVVSRALEIAGRLANDATDVITATAGRGASPPFDWVTDTGRTLERHTRRVLAAEFPGIPVATADAPVRDAVRWELAAVDGTANYLAGLPWCAYSLALLDADGPVVGVVADPYRAQIYAAARGRGARANGVAFTLADRADAAGTIVCTELLAGQEWPGMTAFCGFAARAHARVRVLGSAALAVTEVALGHAAATVLHGYQRAEVAAALALAAEAGAEVLDPSGASIALPADGLLVAAPGVTDQILGWWLRARLG